MSRYIDVDEITKDFNTFQGAFSIHFGIMGDIRIVCNAKPADVRPNTHARWIRQESPLGMTHAYECSKCGRTIYAPDDGLDDYPFCHCGAEMDNAKAKDCTDSYQEETCEDCERLEICRQIWRGDKE